MRFPEFNDSGKLQLRKTQSSTEIFVENLEPAWSNPQAGFFIGMCAEKIEALATE